MQGVILCSIGRFEGKIRAFDSECFLDHHFTPRDGTGAQNSVYKYFRQLFVFVGFWGKNITAMSQSEGAPSS